MNRFFTVFFLFVFACSPKVQQPLNPKPAWLSAKPSQPGYYTGIGHSNKTGNNNYVQEAKKSALEDLVSEIKVNVSSSSVLSTFEDNQEFREQYEQIIKTTAADEIEEFEQAGAWEDDSNYWVYYRLSIQRYREIKEEQRRNAVILSTDYLEKAQQADASGERLQALGFYFQAFRSVEKYLGEAIAVKVNGKDILLVNEIYASIQTLLDKIQLKVTPAEILINRRLNLNAQTVTANAFYKDLNKPAALLPLTASFEKGKGEVFPEYKTTDDGSAKILISKITSRELEQTVGVKLNIDAISGSSSPVYNLISKRLQVPSSQIVLKVQRPIAFMTSEEKSFGQAKSNFQISNRLKNLLANSGFEFTGNKGEADLLFEVSADSEKGSVSGSIYVTYLTGVIRVTALREGKEIYATTLDRVKGYGLDYDKSSQDAYNKALEMLEKERLSELLNNVLQ
ncbi:MAG: LPP20 family lipoprotein [Cyclobacteriaceae bacterium]